MPTIGDTTGQMDQSIPGFDQAKSPWSHDHWISVNPTEKREEVRVNLTSTLPYHFP